MNRNRMIAGIGILTLLGILVVVGLSLLFLTWKSRQPQINQRSPVPALAYCDANQAAPCIVSFSLDADGNMLVNILTPNASFPEFYLKIAQSDEESVYECRGVEKFPTHVYCIGEQMPLGETLQFLIISSDGDTLLAEGSFVIVGLEFPTPEIASTTTGTQPAESAIPTDGFLTEAPSPIQTTPSPSSPNPTPITPAYPNPSYP